MKKPILMLIDDNETFHDLFSALPGAEKYTIKTFNSPMDALDDLNSDTADVIITDVEMPEMSGETFAQKVQDSYPDIPIIFITAFASTDKAVQAIKSGVFYYFEKPLIQTSEFNL